MFFSKNKKNKNWSDLRVGITGASGSLGNALSKELRNKGAYVIGLTHKDNTKIMLSEDTPQEWLTWNCGKEFLLDELLSTIDILILNHGINPKGSQGNKDLNNVLEINAYSTWRLIERFERITLENKNKKSTHNEIWINTSEAEIQPALSPGYELSKRLIGQLVSIKWNNISKKRSKSNFKIRKLILGPFLSKLNPIGIMNAEKVASQIIFQSELNLPLIIVSPNPLTYILMPIVEFTRFLYFNFTENFYKENE